MSSLIETQHETLLRSVVERYRRDGYDVNVAPRPGAIPFDLGGYVPDMIAQKGDLMIIVEVKTQADRISFDQLRSVVDEIKRHEGWRFVLVTAQDTLGLSLPHENEDRFSWAEVALRVKDAQRLSDLGENEAAYLTLWIAFERMMRFQASTIALPLDRLAPSILIRQLYSQGELSMTQFDTALRCQEIRNRIIHGFPAPDLRSAASSLGTLVRELLECWSAPADKC